jgi:hypothetical protein
MTFVSPTMIVLNIYEVEIMWTNLIVAQPVSRD